MKLYFKQYAGSIVLICGTSSAIAAQPTPQSSIDDQLRSAEQGNLESMDKLARRFRDGIGINTDLTQAVRWFRKAASQGFAPSKAALGRLMQLGYGVAKDESAGLILIREAAEQKDPGGLRCLGYAYEEGLGTPKDKSLAQMHFLAALNLLKPLADQGNADAQSNLGFMYANGQGVPKDEAEAVRWYRKAADQGNAGAQNSLGSMYENGKGVERDVRAALVWYQRAAEQGETASCESIGNLYFYGTGVDKDQSQAAKWFVKAAVNKKNSWNFIHSYESAHSWNQGNDAFQKIICKWLAEQPNDSDAIYALGARYIKGLGVRKNIHTGLNLLHKSIDMGNAEAMLCLGEFLMDGKDLARNEKEARAWIQKAIKNGSESASSYLRIHDSDLFRWISLGKLSNGDVFSLDVKSIRRTPRGTKVWIKRERLASTSKSTYTAAKLLKEYHSNVSWTLRYLTFDEEGNVLHDVDTKNSPQMDIVPGSIDEAVKNAILELGTR